MERWLKSEPFNLNFSPEQIDEENGIIRDVVMAQVGPAKGHGYWLEQGFIDRLVAYDQKHYSENGLKARFGHPAMSDTSMGKQMGYFKNFRVRGGDAIADLHLLESANLSPSQPGMRKWMLSMAKEATDFVMSSIVFRTFSFYQYDPEDGQRVDLEVDRWGDPRTKFKNERVYVDFNEENGDRHLYTDLVEAGAATNALFGQQFNQDKFAVRVVSFLQENADILSFIQANPQKIIEMCETLNIPIEMDKKKEKMGLWRQLGQLIFTEETETTETEEKPEATADTPESDVIEEETVALSVVEELREELRSSNELVGQLQAQVEELQKKPLVEPTSYEEETGTGEDSDAYLCPTTLKAMGR